MIGRKMLVVPAGAIALAGLVLAGSHFALAQDYDSGDADTQTRIQRLERDLRDLQQEVYRGGAAGAPRSLTPPPASADVPPAQAAPLAQRLADMEDTLQRLTGQIEELQNQNRQLTIKVERLERALEFQQGNPPMGTAPAADAPAPAPQAAAAPQPQAGLAPGPSTLGTIPSTTPMPVPKPQGTNVGVATAPAAAAPGQRVASLPPAAGGTQAEYDAAMALLRRAQYPAAQAAFRAFADAHPTDPRAADALYWSGDIAYSARRDYASAARAFVELLKKYGKAGRAPESMLKLGLSLIGLGQKQEGCSTLAALPARYPNAAPALVARAAAERKRAACA